MVKKQSQLQALSFVWLRITIRNVCDVSSIHKIRKYLDLSLCCINEKIKTEGVRWFIQDYVTRVELITIVKVLKFCELLLGEVQKIIPETYTINANTFQ